MFRRTPSQQLWNVASSSPVRGSSTTCSTPSLPMTQGTPTKSPRSPYSPSSSALAGMTAFSSWRTMLTIRAAVVAMPYSVQNLPAKVTQPPPMDSFCRASLSKRNRSSVLAQSSRGLPRKLTQDQGAN